jgi:hypothetical protein
MRTKEQRNEYSKKYAKEHPEKIKAYYQKNKIKIKEYRDKNKDQKRNSMRIKEFGINNEEYNQLFIEQNGVCAICFKPERAKQNGILVLLAIDHDHKTGKIRGLLCTRCNVGLGHFNDDPILLRSATKYLTSN